MNKKRGENYLKKRDRQFLSRLDAIYEISARNELPFSKVLPVYIGVNYKIYSKAKKEDKNFKSYNPVLEERVFRLTERILENNRIREMKKYKKLEQVGTK